MTCVTWSAVDGRHFRPLCGNLLRRETDGSEVAPDGSCSICIGPKTQFGVCADCVDPPAAYAYRISMTFDGNGFGGAFERGTCDTNRVSRKRVSLRILRQSGGGWPGLDEGSPGVTTEGHEGHRGTRSKGTITLKSLVGSA